MKPSNACRLLSDNWKIVQFDFNKGLEAGAYKKNFYNAESLNARIPQTVPSILFANGKIADPYFADNVLTLDWIEKKEWWFYTDIIINRKPGRKYSIFFEGINYRAEIWFNSVQIGILEGMFNSSEFSIPEEIIAKGQNRLSLRLRSQENSWEDQPARDISRGTIRTQGTVAQFSYYWNWAPHLIPIGIWRPVYLREKSYASLGSLDASTGISSNLKTGNVNIKCSIIYNTHSFFAGKKNKSSRRVILCGDLKNPSGKIVCSKAVNINIPAAGSGIKNCRLKISVKNPKLWWPNGYGDQPLYKLEIKLAESGGKPIESTGRSMAFREIKLIRNTDSAAVQALSGQSNRMWSIKGDPYPWTLVVNKKRIFAKGVNIVPFDSMYNFTSERYRRILELARDSHLIVLRVWGGGITENDEFYDLCDKYGLLVWQEF
ncbi:MAG TPA: hypothetical protein DC049_09975, partial [Spirochaetia bacterium]|nr:hypothetical protein [Spirochaetia bacterium]